MRLQDLPDGSVVVVGHPANGHTATKRGGQWRSGADGRRLDLDPRDVTKLLYVGTGA